MKLYATVTSERASKGQGGNNFIEYQLLSGSAKDSRQIMILNARVEGEDVVVEIWSEGRKNTLKYRTSLHKAEKGEKQTGEDISGCIYDHDHKDGSKCDYH